MGVSPPTLCNLMQYVPIWPVPVVFFILSSHLRLTWGPGSLESLGGSGPAGDMSPDQCGISREKQVFAFGLYKDFSQPARQQFLWETQVFHKIIFQGIWEEWILHNKTNLQSQSFIFPDDPGHYFGEKASLVTIEELRDQIFQYSTVRTYIPGGMMGMVLEGCDLWWEEVRMWVLTITHKFTRHSPEFL